MKYIDAEKLYEYLEQVGTCYPRYIDNIVDNAVSNVIDGIKTFVTSLQQEQPEVGFEKEFKRYFGTNDCNLMPSFLDCARHFYEFGLNARKED